MIKVDGAELACYRNVSDPSALTLVHFHGNGECVADYVPAFVDVYESIGLNSLFVEYREYGASTGKAQLVAMLGDGEKVLEAAGLQPENVIVFGRSIGALYAVELASRQPSIGGLIIESGIGDAAERLLAFADIDFSEFDRAEVLNELRVWFDHARKLGRYTNPLLILHAENDTLVGMPHAEQNYEWAASTKKQLVRLPHGNHNTIFPFNSDLYLSTVRRFVDSIRRRA